MGAAPAVLAGQAIGEGECYAGKIELKLLDASEEILLAGMVLESHRMSELRLGEDLYG
jgi:hypothetical protein